MNRQRTLTRTNLLGFVCTYWEPSLQGEDVHHITLFLYHPRLFFFVLLCRCRFSQRHLFFFWLKKKMEEVSSHSITSTMGQGLLKDTRRCVAFFPLSVLTYVSVGVCFTFFVIDMRSCVCVRTYACACLCVSLWPCVWHVSAADANSFSPPSPPSAVPLSSPLIYPLSEPPDLPSDSRKQKHTNKQTLCLLSRVLDKSFFFFSVFFFFL